jgi:HEAT repeat protein
MSQTAASGRYLRLALGALLSLLGVCHFGTAAEKADEKLLREAGIAADGGGLLDFLRSVSPADADPEQAEQLVRQLGSENFKLREEATRKLVAMGCRALPALRQSLKGSDAEIARRATACIEQIDRPGCWGLPLAAVRLLVKQRPPGAVEVLLRYLPYAPDEEVEEEVWYAVDGLAGPDDRLDPALVKALTDASAPRRAAAACIVARRGGAEGRREAARLLADASPLVRLRAAQGLLATGDKSALSVLVALLGEAPAPLAWQAEELLRWVARQETPDVVVGAASCEERDRCRRAWDNWLRERGIKLELASGTQTRPCPRLLLVGSERIGEGKGARVGLYGSDGKLRWQREGLRDVCAVHLLSQERVLVAERHRIMECTLSGRVVWENTPVDAPLLACQLLPTGRLFVATVSRLGELVPVGEGRFTSHLQLEGSDLETASALPSGHILCTYRAKNIIGENDPLPRLSPHGIRGTYGTRSEQHGVEALPEDRFLVAAPSLGVCEVTRNGKRLWEWQIPGALQSTRLRNDHILVRRTDTIDEFDRTGVLLWTMRPGGDVVYGHVCLRLVGFGLGARGPADPEAQLVAFHARRLGDPDAAVRCTAAVLLEEFGPHAEPAIPALVGLLGDPDQQVRGVAVDALVTTGPASVPALTEALRHADKEVRARAAYCLGWFKGQARPAIPLLTKTLGDPDAWVRIKAAEALASITPDAPAAVATLIEIAEEKQCSESNRSAAIHDLGNLGPRGGVAVPMLLRLLREGKPIFRIEAANALGDIRPRDKEAVTILLKTLQEGDDVGIRQVAAIALGKIGMEPERVMPVLVEALDGKGAKNTSEALALRFGAVNALGAFGPKAKAAVPKLVAILRKTPAEFQPGDFDLALCHNVILALEKMGPDAREAIPILRELAQGNPLSRFAKQALKKIDENK